MAHAYPRTTDPQANARLDGAPAHVATYDSPIDPRVGDGAAGLVRSYGANAPDVVDGTTQASISPTTDLVPGPYTVAWTSYSAEDGHTAQGFYTFVVNGGPVGILNGAAQAQAPAADFMATLTVDHGG